MKSDDLIPVQPAATNILLEKQTAKMLASIMTDLGCEGQIVPVSGYRTRREQQEIYRDSLREHGEDFTRQYVALPGCSEHQTGLAIDLAENKADIDFIRPDFPYVGICGEFRRVATHYGFIERYPPKREEITHIAHEPWHFRYVGYPHSEIMEEKTLTLEEYTDYLKQFPVSGPHLDFSHDAHDFEVFYVPVISGSESVIEVPERAIYQISGDNENSVIVTLWRSR